jgi:enoyl-CoA hydratase/carnithine racemase
MNWLERARRELREKARERTANTAERPPTTVTAVRDLANSEKSAELRDAWEERAAILEYDGALARDEAERIAWLSICGSKRLH